MLTYKKRKRSNSIKEYTYLGCPLTLSRSAWCYRLCSPDINGNGRCGRLAPHSFKSKIQICIKNYNKKSIK